MRQVLLKCILQRKIEVLNVPRSPASLQEIMKLLF